MDRDTELSLVEGLRSGDPAAFNAVYDAYRARVFAFLLRLSRSRTVAEDLLDENWLRVTNENLAAGYITAEDAEATTQEAAETNIGKPPRPIDRVTASSKLRR